MDALHKRNVCKHPFCNVPVRNEWLLHRFREGERFFNDGLTAGTSHILVRAKLTTLTVGSLDMIGINCDLKKSCTFAWLEKKDDDVR